MKFKWTIALGLVVFGLGLMGGVSDYRGSPGIALGFAFASAVYGFGAGLVIDIGIYFLGKMKS